MISNNSTAVGTVGGTFLSIVPNVNSDDIVRTAVLAVVGAVVSCIFSLLLQNLFKKRGK